MAASLEKDIGRTVHYVQVPYEAAQQGMGNSGMPVWFAQDPIKIMKAWLQVRGSVVNTDAENITGRKPLTLKEFFENHRILFIVKDEKAA